MVALNESTIAGYGADSSEEGAVLFIYNVQFKLVQAVQKLKLYTEESKLWKIEDKLLLAANRHLAVAPYNLEPQRLKAMLGSTLNFQNNNPTEDDIVVIQETQVVDWGSNTESITKINRDLPVHELKKNLATRVSAALREGTNDATLHNSLIPQLIESKDASSILWCLENFKELPVELLIQILIFSLKMLTNKSTQNGYEKNSKEEIYTKLLREILKINHTDVTLVSYLRTELNFDNTLHLLNHLLQELDPNQFSFNQIINDFQLYEWTKLLLDSHYQDYILSQDDNVQETLEKLKQVTDDEVSIFFLF